MPDSVESIIETFPHPTLTPIDGLPAFATIRQIQVELNANSSSIHSNLGDGQLGLLYLTVSQATYDSLSDVPFIPPVNPGPVPIIPRASTAREAADARVEHAENKRVFNQYIATDKALKSQIIQAVHDLYLKTLKHRITGYANVSTREMLNHLYTSYGKMTPQDLQLLDSEMKTPYDPQLPIENLYEQIENAKDVAEAAGAPYADNQILNIAYNLVFQCNVFHDTCREWRRLPAASKTWPAFKRMFTEAHQDFRDSNSIGHSPYHSANAAISGEIHNTHEDNIETETASALANLAAATATDRAAMAALTSTNAHLSMQLTAVTKNLTAALEKIKRLETSLGTTAPSNPTIHNARLYRPYCWSHGFRVGRKHNSTTCKAPKEGHKKDATAFNMMGGSNVGLDDTVIE